MSEIVLARLTYCPSGRIEEERAFELVLELDDPLPIRDQTPRTVPVKRIYSRGDLAVLKAHNLKSLAYGALGFAEFKVEAAHGESTALKGATVDLWVHDAPQKPGRKLAMKESWVGARFVREEVPKPKRPAGRR